MQHAPQIKRTVLAPRNVRVIRSPAEHATVWQAEIIVGVTLHNQAGSLSRCVKSALMQSGMESPVAIVILDDMSQDDWQGVLDEFSEHPELVVIQGNCGSAARARNAILDFVDSSFPKARWVARMDADDCFSTHHSLAAACRIGDAQRARFVIGGNLLVQGGEVLARSNPASEELLHAPFVLDVLQQMAEGRALNELPSCNLLLAAGAGWRYPDIGSAEDHWLVADLLLNHPKLGAILSAPFYADYTLGGDLSTTNKKGEKYLRRRRHLFEVAQTWLEARACPGDFLGFGQEGVVRCVAGWIEKRFYPGALADEKVDWLRRALVDVGPYLPEPIWVREGSQWACRYPDSGTIPAEIISLDQARAFLSFCLQRGIVCRNIKRANFRIDGVGNLIMVDVGNDIMPMDAAVFRDVAARLYALAALEWPDAELARRKSTERQDEILADIPGFTDFYAALLTAHAEQHWREDDGLPSVALPNADDVTLLIKTCAMDAASLVAQVRHITGHLSRPRAFHESVLLIDPFEGPFLRQHCPGDLVGLRSAAHALVDAGLIDRVLIAPDNEAAICAVNLGWFGLDCVRTHSTKDVPVVPQLWAFDQISTRYVLQCDVDVLIGRRDQAHDYLGEMLAALAPDDILGIAFNIPHPEGRNAPYDAPAGSYVPEVRCGLLDLIRLRACRPLPNTIEDGRLTLSWYRSAEQHQRQAGLRTLRGGDARTFYVHPPNSAKTAPHALARIRDLIGQGIVPTNQLGAWDLVGDFTAWPYPRRHEDVVFLLKGRDTPTSRVIRCLASLRAQDDQDFGVVLIDDASDKVDPTPLPSLLGTLRPRTTLIRRDEHVGRIPNFREAISQICVNPETLVVVLDLDDALMTPLAVKRLRQAHGEGHDVILGACFRPDKPLKLYEPDFAMPRETWGGEVWPHLRSFRKRLFDAVPESHFQIDGAWIEECTDYATMVPIVELASHPLYIREYLYFHERSTPRTPESRSRKDKVIQRILAKPSLRGRGE